MGYPCLPDWFLINVFILNYTPEIILIQTYFTTQALYKGHLFFPPSTQVYLHMVHFPLLYYYGWQLYSLACTFTL